VKSVLSKTENFKRGPSPLLRDDHNKLNRSFVVKDRNYLSAKRPGDAYNFSLEFIKMLAAAAPI
jgi:protease I